MSGTLFEMEDPQQQLETEQQLSLCLARSLELNDVESLTVVSSTTIQSNCDGSDSGLDVPSSCCMSRVTLQRGLSSTSGGYTSSNGLEEIYDSCELQLIGGVSPSEQGSECSQKTTPPRRANGSVKKKVAMFEPEPCPSQSQSPVKTQEQLRGRVANLKRAASLPRNGTPTTPGREKPRISNSSSFRVPTNAATPTPMRTPRPQKPDTLPSALNRAQSVQRLAQVQRTPSLSRARTPGTPSDDGRWPANRGSAGARRGMSVTPDVMANRMRGSPAPGGTLPRRRKQQSVEDLSVGRLSRSNSISRAAVVDARMTSSVMLMPTSRRTLAPPATTATAKVNSLRRPQQQLSVPRTRIYHETAVQTALTSEDLEQVLGGGVLQTRALDAVEQQDQSTQAEPDQRDHELEQLRQEVRQLSGKLQREREEKLAMQQELHLNTERVMSMLGLARVVSANAGTPTSEDSGDGSGHDSLLMLESQIQMSGHELFERQQQIRQLKAVCHALNLEMQRSLATQQLLLQEKAAIEQESSELQDFLQHEKAAQCDALRELETEYQAAKAQLANREEEAKVLRDECRHLVRLNEQRRQENRLLQTKYAALENKSRELIHQQNAAVAGASTALSGLHARLDSLVEQLVCSYSISEQDLEDIRFQAESLAVETEHAQNGLKPNGLDLPLSPAAAGDALHTLVLTSDGSLSPQRNQSFIAAVIGAIRQATTHSGKRLSQRKRQGQGSAAAVGYAMPGTLHNNEQTNLNGNGGDDSDSTEMLDSETEPCLLMMDNVLEDVVHPDSHSHNMVSSCTGMISQIELPTELISSQCSQHQVTVNADDSLQQLSQAITNRQQMELHVHKLSVLPMNNRDQCNTEELSCHDSLADLPSLMEYSTAQAVVDQVIEVDTLVTKLLKVLRLVQLDNDNCIQQLIVDKNKLQQHKEDMLEKLKDLEDVNLKLQDELMDATQELMIKGSDLGGAKAEMQRHRNEIDRLNEDICTLSTLCSSYKKLSPTTEFPPMQLLSPIQEPEQGDVLGILNLLKMWHSGGQLQDVRVSSYLTSITQQTVNTLPQPDNNNVERLRIYANQLEHVSRVLDDCQSLEQHTPLQQLRKDMEIVRLNANWTQLLDNANSNSVNTEQRDLNANEADVPTSRP
ncbi:sporulation-specific protein 15 [Drosophila innubila]|uniref:sporulation-specific protein 15 n=1 Tax=Drosophila innubila TaxID=198719 RepID=UPI00148BE682|nr:sporulation-specific protein 15 [Drosophila innubila]XP_034483769.1 sporulation-specific protein 15 [Drosophila innubila]